MTIYEMVKDDPKFKRFCARQTTAKPLRRKLFKVPIPARKGPLSVLGEYSTGRRVKVHALECDGTCRDWTCYEQDEVAVLKKVNGEFVSQVTSYDPSAVRVETIEQGTRDAFYKPKQSGAIEKAIKLLEEQNRLLRELLAA